ncbi:MAG: nucleoside triphosphate pyrophosphohydrolase [Candidatus Kapabacteria bacterium]|nr:nucleoside triphosphate pyrophosphohydrolase [Candidatus Kapabacteria bacterium]
MSENLIKVPVAKNPDDLKEQFEVLVEIIRILRKECPWDRKQSIESIAHLMIEEAYETIDAIHNKDYDGLSKELGDLLLHIIMHSVMAEEKGYFNLMDVIKRIQDKLVFRHPHVFGGLEVSGEEEVVENWENLKKKEGKNSALDGVPSTLPSLLRAERIQHKASRVGFDWQKKEDVWEKVEEEITELKKALLEEKIENKTEEIGDLLFSIVNACRFEGVVAEESLQLTNNKFIKRFQYIEEKVKQSNKKLSEMTLEEMDAIWDEAKKEL